MNKKVSYTYQYLSRTETKKKQSKETQKKKQDKIPKNRMELLPCKNPMKWALCCISVQQFLFPKGGIAAFFMPVGDVDKGQKTYYNDTRMQRELLREAERKDKSFDLYT